MTHAPSGPAVFRAPPGRLPFVLPDFTRLSWVSGAAQATWQPRLTRIRSAWLDLEWRSVRAGVRDGAIVRVDAQTYVHRARTWARAGLVAVPAEVAAVPDATYTASTPVSRPGARDGFVLAVSRDATVAAQLADAWMRRDDREVGAMLGFPACCIDFFMNVWVGLRLVDTTWAMAQVGEDVRELEVEGPTECNILWRWAGVRAVPHLPCRFDCHATAEVGRRFGQLAADEGLGKEHTWLRELLEWPVEWSALHGIAEIKNPLLRISTRTDATADRLVVRRRGTVFPAQMPLGVRFPYNHPPPAPLHEIRRRAPAWYHRDNGFSTRQAMESAHRPIVEQVRHLANGRTGRLLDLGCGNGVLLFRIGSALTGWHVVGVDHNAESIKHARMLWGAAGEFLLGDLFDIEKWLEHGPFEIILLSVARLREADSEQRERLRESFRTSARTVLAYAYSDGPVQGAAECARHCGFEVRDECSRQLVVIR